jgi:CheY-like chemotaxis protein
LKESTFARQTDQESFENQNGLHPVRKVSMKTPPLSNHHILWADDDADDLMLMREALESFDLEHKVVEAHNGEEVLDYLKGIKNPSQFPCLIILDMNMPVLSGRETLVQIKENNHYNTIPVVMFTTSSSTMDHMFCKRYGVEMFTKPDSFEGYQNIIRKMVIFCSIANEEVVKTTHH